MLMRSGTLLQLDEILILKCSCASDDDDVRIFKKIAKDDDADDECETNTIDDDKICVIDKLFELFHDSRIKLRENKKRQGVSFV